MKTTGNIRGGFIEERYKKKELAHDILILSLFPAFAHCFPVLMNADHRRIVLRVENIRFGKIGGEYQLVNITVAIIDDMNPAVRCLLPVRIGHIAALVNQ